VSYPSFYLERLDPHEPAPGTCVTAALSADEYHHMCVMRIERGEKVRLAYADGTGFIAELVDDLKDATDADGDTCLLRFTYVEGLPVVWRPDLTLVQGISKGERFEQVIRQTTELGVKRIIPLMCERCIVRLDERKAASRVERWRSVARSAAKQSGGLAIPEIDAVMGLEDALSAVEECDAIVIPWEEAVCGSLADALSETTPTTSVALFIGPEGGFTADEVARVKARGGKAITLGPTILRTETAGVVASALALYELGGMGRR